ncbi:MAG: glucose-1-phosphate thymidylyltransferase [Proteobacteria bacterium TMED51]|nr:MAG: glucose-1-phosphate thymidylyltransferase [Proteobacteria bacterium TMED51]|tara:strand:- start:3177 stop:4061 length:885 start_codon:yes stop_codon:yes gene_type:complete
MRGLILAGGAGTRLSPVTQVVSKQLLPVYDKPMIYYPLSVLMLAGIRDIMLISTPEDTPRFQELLGTGEQWGLNLAYAVQPSPDGLAQALIIGSEFVGNGPCALILGDNIFHGDQLADAVRRASELKNGATVFAYPVKDPERYGVVSFDKEGRAHTLEEKPQSPRSRYAVTGLYFYDHNAPDYARSLTPSNRGELEITDLNRVYLENGSLNVELLGRGTAWLDTGTHESLLQASVFIETLETRQGMKICCPEEIAFRMNYIGIEDLSVLASKLGKSTYGTYLRQLVTEYQSGNS